MLSIGVHKYILPWMWLDENQGYQTTPTISIYVIRMMCVIMSPIVLETLIILPLLAPQTPL
jgi:hypothetical protein